MERARAEIWQSWRATSPRRRPPRAKELFDRHKLPAFHDPFAGGGSLPLEAQRLGLESYSQRPQPRGGADQQAMIEIPAEIRRQAAGEPAARAEKSLGPPTVERRTGPG